MKKRIISGIVGAMLITIVSTTAALAADFATYSKTGYYFAGYNRPTNPWNGNTYTDLGVSYKGNDSSDTGLYATQYVGTQVGNSTAIHSAGNVRLTANQFIKAGVTFKSTHYIKVDSYQREYLTTNP